MSGSITPSLADIIQHAIYAGAAAGAQASGRPHQVYRPTDALNPVQPGSLVATLPAAFSGDLSYGFKAAKDYADATWSCVVDGNQTRPGDVLMGASTWFIASQEPLLPILAVRCNAVASLSRPSKAGRGGGRQAYGGDTERTETALMAGWPCSLLQGTKGERGDVQLPGDVRMPWFNVIMPAMAGVELLTDDVLTDGLGHRYKVSSAELTAMGWRLTVMLAEA